MLELEFSAIIDSESDEQVLSSLIDDFSCENDVTVNLVRMNWANAWNELLRIASHGRGPHVSHIGGTWTSSLITMNALRPFLPSELESLGGPSAFMRSTWLTTCLHGQETCYAIPWTSYLYVICYHRGLLGQVGIDESKAFGSINSFSATVQTLSKSALEIPWINLPISSADEDFINDYLHTAASWVWGAGGQFLDDNGSNLVFDSPESVYGISRWLDTFRAVRPEHAFIGKIEGLDWFAQGKVGAILTDIRAADSFLATENLPLGAKNLGVATLTEVPWCSGGNMVIWNHTRGYPEHEKAAVALVQFLNNHASQLTWARDSIGMPARLDVLEKIYPQEHPLRDAVFLAVERGLSYMGVPLWRRVEHQLAVELSAILNDFRENPTKKSEQIVLERLRPLARRLNLAFGS